MTSLALLFLASAAASAPDAERPYGPVEPVAERQSGPVATPSRYLAGEPERWRAESEPAPQLRWRGKTVRMRVPFG